MGLGGSDGREGVGAPRARVVVVGVPARLDRAVGWRGDEPRLGPHESRSSCEERGGWGGSGYQTMRRGPGLLPLLKFGEEGLNPSTEAEEEEEEEERRRRR